jgi:hypothetical protein
MLDGHDSLDKIKAYVNRNIQYNGGVSVFLQFRSNLMFNLDYFKYFIAEYKRIKVK